MVRFYPELLVNFVINQRCALSNDLIFPVSWFGFTGLCTTSALISFAFAPCMLMLRNPPCTNQTTSKSQQTQLLNSQEGAVKYVSYTNDLDSPDLESSSAIGGGGGSLNNYSRNKSFDMVP